MLLAAGVLADCTPDDIQKRAMARYTFLYADSLLLWAQRWRNQLKRVPSTSRRANAAKASLNHLATVLDSAFGVRDYLAAKRKPVARMRADDIEATSLLWSAVEPSIVQAIGNAAICVYDELSEGDSMVQMLGLSTERQARVRSALPSRDPAYWHLAADTAADLRPFTLPAASGGNLGRLIAQINDVAGHLDVLLRIAPVLHGVLPYDWLVRSAMVVELNALLDLTLAPPPGETRHVMYSLLDLCRQGRAQAAADELERLRDSIDPEGWIYVRWARNTIGAHVDDELTMCQVHAHLVELDYQGVIGLAEHVLDWLDVLGASQLDLKLLLIGERKIVSWPTDPSLPATGSPPVSVAESLARFFRSTDSPYMSVSASNMGSPILAGISAGRTPQPRTKVTVPARMGILDAPRLLRLRPDICMLA